MRLVTSVFVIYIDQYYLRQKTSNDRYVGYSGTYGGQTVRIWFCLPYVQERTLSQMPFWFFYGLDWFG